MAPSPTTPPDDDAGLRGISIVIPAYNEESGIASVVQRLVMLARRLPYAVEILVVDDGSSDRTPDVLGKLQAETDGRLRVLRNETNRGYGFALKRGIAAAVHEIVVITDADGTYPYQPIAELAQRVAAGAAMAVGARALTSRGIPLARRPAKWLLGSLAAVLAGRRVPDLNSGLRAMQRGFVTRLAPILPDGFSFTTTVTLAALINGDRVDFVPIDYARRSGRSKIRPLRDTANFLDLIVRTVLSFRPLRIFAPLALALFAAAAGVVSADFVASGGRPQLGEVSVVLFLAALQVMVTGFLADLAAVSMRHPRQGRPARTAWLLYRRPLGVLMVATLVALVGSIALHYRDASVFQRELRPKTLALYVTTLQLLSASLLADLLQRRGRLV